MKNPFNLQTMKNIQIHVSELFLLNNFFNNTVPQEVIDNYFTKKNHRSNAKDYKEGSPKYLAEIAKDEEIALLPDYNIVEDFHGLTITLDYSNKVEFSILTYTYTRSGYDYDMEESYEVEVIAKFLCKNVYWATDIIRSIDDLLANDDVKFLLFMRQEEELKLNIRENLESLGNCFSFLLREIVLQAHLEFKPVKYYSEYRAMGQCVVIGNKDEETIYSETELEKVYEDYINRVKFYDEQDRVIEYISYLGSYLTFHREHSSREKQL
jgi:hypothetical protein